MENLKQQIFIDTLFIAKSNNLSSFPDKIRAEIFIDRIFDFLFLSGAHQFAKADELGAEWELCKKQFTGLVLDIVLDEEKANKITDIFFEAIPGLYNRMLKDAEAILQFDPAAGSVEEVLITYPGFYATAIYRLSHQLWQQQIKILPRIFTEYAHSKTGIDIHPGAIIGDAFFIDHGTGIVIGETAVIKNNVKIYQGVTLGALNVKKADAKSKRHPTIEDNVTIYSSATILGGDTVIGRDSIIGGNVWLTYSVHPYSVVYHKSDIKVREANPFPEPINFSI